MIGFSWETCIGLIASLFMLLLASPAGIRKTSEQVISIQAFYGGSFLTLCLSLVNIIIYIWVFPNGEATQNFSISALSVWGSILSCSFGAIYWVAICLFFIRGIRTKAGVLILLAWPILMFFNNYLPNIYHATSDWSPAMSIWDSTTNWIATGLITSVLSALIYAYWTNKHKWSEL
jgi:hypothetical protein